MRNQGKIFQGLIETSDAKIVFQETYYLVLYGISQFRHSNVHIFLALWWRWGPCWGPYLSALILQKVNLSLKTILERFLCLKKFMYCWQNSNLISPERKTNLIFSYQIYHFVLTQSRGKIKFDKRKISYRWHFWFRAIWLARIIFISMMFWIKWNCFSQI